MQCNLFLEKTPLVETSFPFEDKEHIAKVGYVKSSALPFAMHQNTKNLN